MFGDGLRPRFTQGAAMARDLTSTPAIHVQTYGDAPRRAVALHCTLGHSGIWKGMAAAMAEPLTLVAPDLPGHGRSAEAPGAGDFIAECAAIAADLIGDEPVDLIGHSGGAVSALQFAIENPDLVRSLTLIEPVLFAAARGTPEYDDFVAAMQPYAAALAQGDRDAAAEAFTGIWGVGRPWAELEAHQRAYIADRIGYIGAGMPALDGDNFGILDEGRLEALEMPVMILIGGDSHPVIGRIAEEIAARLPDVGLAEVPGAGHMLTATHASQVAGLVDINLTRD